MLFYALLFVAVGKAACSSRTEAPPTPQSGVQCHDWGVHQGASVGVYEGESGRIPCPLFSFPSLYNYNQSSGLTLLWYRHTSTHELEQPIDLRAHTFLKHRDSLWIQPATLQDRGLYICMLRNTTSCAKVGVQLQVFVRNGVCDGTLHRNVTVPFQKSYTLRCPDLQHLPSVSYNVTWYHKCRGDLSVFYHRQVEGDEVKIYNLLIGSEGPYTCVVSYQSNGHTLQFTRTINIKPVSPNCGTDHPRVLNPTSGQIYTVTLGEAVNLTCRVFLPCMENEEQQVWWSIDKKTVEELADPRYSSPARSIELEDYGDQTVQKVLHVSEFSAADLQREFRCSARNSRGFNTSVANLQKEVYIPSVELGCGLGVTLAVAVLLFVLYRVYKLEVHLLYRSWFGTDERYSDDKEYDVYISYARNGEEEEFVMTTLRRVLEVELGYSVCIFDRDSLPGGTITDETLRFVGRSRRLVIVVSAFSAVQGTQALLELQAGLAMLRGGHLRVVLIQYKLVNKQCWVKELRRARVALTLIRWQGEKSLPLSSRFWKQLQLELPIRKHTTHTDTERTLDLTDHAKRKHPEESTALILDSLSKPDTQAHQKQRAQSSSAAV
ncbi:interleukin-1 receptor accessory protein isoform X2 [Colossoma macropomum]|nr:interleukin-1 receptor accessory protein isoform X2 [Colossoma macropomum]XP_036413784.1 interleukin-1 receptor accessory protein isoform X2 [Colossoma macropomum]XP_036413792.1 interleukin-1 receptor accessory protein isoform X2 [Colossoma macropomum]